MIEPDTKKCPMCAEKIKAEAVRCRFCGHKEVRLAPSDEMQRNEIGGAFKVGKIAAVALFGVLILIGKPSPRASEGNAEDQRTGVNCLPGFDGSPPSLRDRVKNSLREPASFELVDTTITPLNDENTHTVTMTYRARNGFGGLNTEVVRARVGADCNLIDVLDR